MKKERYIQIKDFLKGLIIGTEWEGNVFTVGGCVRDEIMGLEIKDIDIYECEHMKGKKLRRLQYECKTEERFRNLMIIINADNKAHAADKCMPKQVEFILRRTEEMQEEGSAMFGYKLPLTGKEIMDLKGIKTGPAVKECLEYLMKIAFVNPLREKEEFVKILLGYRLQK